MKMNLIRISKGVTASVGKYESIRFDCAVEIELGKGDKASAVYDKGMKFVDARLNHELKDTQEALSSTSVFRL